MPLLVYWSWDYKNTCSLNPQIPINNFTTEYINIVCRDDESGEPLIFENLNEAEATLEENCQDGIIIPLIDTMGLLKRLNSLFDSGKIVIEEETKEDKMNFIQLKRDIKDLFK